MELQRKLGLWTCVLLAIGNTIGVGIFVTPGVVMERVGSVPGVFAVWSLGGLLALCGALTYAELSAMMPHAGGSYVFVRAAYGPFWAFVFGWMFTLVTSPGALAVLSVGCMKYAGVRDPFLIKTFALVFLGILTALNYLGVELGSRTQNAVTAVKVGIMSIAILAGFVVGQGSFSNFTVSSSSHLGGFAAALLPIVFTYSGWNAATFIGGEVKDPGRTIPLSLLIATLTLIVIYLGFNAVYLYALPLAQASGTIQIGRVSAAALFGSWAGDAFSYLIALSVFGCTAATLMVNPRVTYAMGRDKLFFAWAGQVNPRFETPGNAILIHGALAGLLILSGTFEQLVDYVSLPLVIYSAMAVGAVLVMRRKYPDIERPYRAWGYPWTPLIYLAISLWIVVDTLRDTRISIAGLMVMAIGLPGYWAWKKFQNAN